LVSLKRQIVILACGHTKKTVRVCVCSSAQEECVIVTKNQMEAEL